MTSYGDPRLLSALAAHTRTSEGPWDRDVCHYSQSYRAEKEEDMIAPINNGQTYEQSTDHIPHESQLVHSQLTWQMTLKTVTEMG
jgi:hypothetical protein